jgi:hypothetical protein
MSTIIFDELKFINNFVKEYNSYDGIIYFNLFLEDFIEIYTDDNTIHQNMNIINHYTNNSIENAIELFKYYYNSKFDFIGSKLNYAELASIVLYHNFFDKLLTIIIDNYNSSDDTDLDD